MSERDAVRERAEGAYSSPRVPSERTERAIPPAGCRTKNTGRYPMFIQYPMWRRTSACLREPATCHTKVKIHLLTLKLFQTQLTFFFETIFFIETCPSCSFLYNESAWGPIQILTRVCSSHNVIIRQQTFMMLVLTFLEHDRLKECNFCYIFLLF